MTINSKMDNYFSKHYDEKQLVDRYRISFETMWLTFILILISGMIRIFHGSWAATNTEMVILLSLPATYFLIRSIMKGAYFSRTEKSYTFSLILFAIIGILNLATIIVIASRGDPFIENGILTENLFQLFIALPLLSIPITYLIKKAISKDIKEDEE
jgi:hypothetical protein